VAELVAQADSAVERFRAEIADVLADAEVHHIGATALGSGLTKGDVDVNVRVTPVGFGEAVSALRARYDVAQPESWTAGFASFSASDYPMPFGIQLTAIGSANDYLLALRDRMRADPELLGRYDACKQEAAARGAEAYWEAKNAFLQRLLGV
jgi:GrpB-like predicted nucleotidyltransferase (UPF0157 family)